MLANIPQGTTRNQPVPGINSAVAENLDSEGTFHKECLPVTAKLCSSLTSAPSWSPSSSRWWTRPGGSHLPFCCCLLPLYESPCALRAPACTDLLQTPQSSPPACLCSKVIFPGRTPLIPHAKLQSAQSFLSCHDWLFLASDPRDPRSLAVLAYHPDQV